jgi:peptidoglycan/LPS O-acetylase OafA/YrhL
MALINFSENSSFSRSFMYIAFTLWILGYGICKYLGLNLPLEPSGWLRLGLFGLPATLLVLCLVTMEKYSNLRLPKWLILIGNASFSLYLSHLLIIATIGRIWQKFGIIDVWANGLILMVMFFCAILFGLVSFQLLEQPLLKATRRDW